jgi:MFS family permease
MVTYVTVVATIVERLEARLPRSVYVLQAGLVVNAFGNGAANPFILLYLHDARGIPLAAAGLAGAANAACGLGSSLVGGAVADRVGPRATVLGGLAIATGTFLAYPFVTSAWEAVVAGGMLGVAAGGWLTGQSVLLTALVPQQKRHIAFAQQRVAANVGLGLGGLAGGLIASSTSAYFRHSLRPQRPDLRRLRCLRRSAAHRPHRGTVVGRGYRLVIRDRTLLRLLAIDAAVVAGAVALLNGLLPVYARDTVGIRESAIGVLFLCNSLLIIGGQLPVVRLVEGRRRSRALALMATLFGCSWLLVLAAGFQAGFLLLLVGITAFSGAECIYDSVRSPLVADLAPTGLSGRYLASAGISWQLGFVVGPAAGAALLGLAPAALWITSAGVCFLAAIAALRLDRALPAEVSVTARSRR